MDKPSAEQEFVIVDEKDLFYHFMKAEHALEAIRKRHLKIADLDDVNDIFESLPMRMADHEEEKESEFFLLKTESHVMLNDEQSLTSGVVCFSRDFTNPMLWGHYADKGQGVCLGFSRNPREKDFPIHPVKYVPRRMESHKINHLSYPEQLAIKSYHWEYEQEYRVFLAKRDLHASGEFFVFPFAGKLDLREVIIGPRCGVKDIGFKIASALIDYRNSSPKDNGLILILQARRSLSDFQIEKGAGWLYGPQSGLKSAYPPLFNG